MWTIMAFIVIGMVAGWSASLIVRGDMHPRDWGLLFIIGVGGSLIGGIIVNLSWPTASSSARRVSSAPSPSPPAALAVTACRTAGHEASGGGTNADGKHREPKGGQRAPHQR